MARSDLDDLLDDLPRHQAFLRRVAADLAGDRDADDAVQDAWVAALESPRGAIAAPRAWLRRVVRHRAATRIERDARRRARERTVARDEAAVAPDADGALGLVQSVAAAIQRLPEELRDALYLRTYEGRSVREIAQRTGATVEATSSRLRRARERLRRELDGEHGAERWRALLLPFAVPPTPTPSTPTTPTSAAAGASLAASPLSWIAMTSQPLATVLVVSAGVLGLFALVRALDDDASLGDADDRRVARSGAVVDVSAPNGTGGPIPPTSTTASTRSALDPAPSAAAVEGSPRASVELSVTFVSDGAPASGAPGTYAGGGAPVTPFRLDAEGRASFTDLSADAVTVSLEGRGRWRVVARAGEATPLHIELPAGVTVTGRVVDGNGQPVPGADIVLADRSDGPALAPIARAQGDGTFVVRDLPAWTSTGPDTLIAARARGFATSSARRVVGEPGTRATVRLELGRDAAYLTGRVVRHDGTPAAGAHLDFDSHDDRRQAFAAEDGLPMQPAPPLRLVADADGRFSSERVAPGRRRIRVRLDDAPERTIERELRSGPNPELVVTLDPGGRVVVTLVGSSSQRVVGRHVSLGSGAEYRFRHAWTDAAGRCVFDGVPAGPADIALEGGEAREVDVAPGRTTEVALELESRRSLAGRVVDEVGAAHPNVGVYAIREAAPGRWSSSALTDAQGRFALTDVPPDMDALVLRTSPVFDCPPLKIVPWPGRVTEEAILVLERDRLPTARLRLRLEREDGAPAETAECVLRLADPDETWTRRATPSVRGDVEFERLVAGEYVLTAAARGAVEHRTEPFELESADELDLGSVRLRSGGHVVAVARRPGGTAFGVDDRLDGVQGRLVAEVSGEAFGLTWTGRELRSETVPTGAYVLHVSGFDVATTELPIDVPLDDTTRVDVTLEPGGKRLVEFAPPLPPGSTVRVESTEGLVALDGSSFEGERFIVSGLRRGDWTVTASGPDGLAGEAAFRVESLALDWDAPVVVTRR